MHIILDGLQKIPVNQGALIYGALNSEVPLHIINVCVLGGSILITEVS